MRAGSGEDAVESRRECGRSSATRHADLRSIAVGSVPGGAGQLRNGTRERLECRRLQAAHAGYCFDGRHFAAVDAVGGVWGEIVSSCEYRVARLGRELIAPFFFGAEKH